MSKLTLRFDCDRERLSQSLGPKFIKLPLDEQTRLYVDAAAEHRHSALVTGVHRGLRRFMSDFDVNGLLGTYSMHLLSTAQWRLLLGGDIGGTLLDVGAGDGNVTACLAPLFDGVTVTETSGPMIRRLRKRGYRAHHLDVSHAEVPGAPYDAVALLNVLDRCSAPLSLLESVRLSLRKRGLLIIALALPYRPFFFAGSRTPSPMRPLPLNAEEDWETSVNVLVSEVLAPLDFEVMALARAPYLSQGDSQQELYQLDDVIVIAQRTDGGRSRDLRSTA